MAGWGHGLGCPPTKQRSGGQGELVLTKVCGAGGGFSMWRHPGSAGRQWDTLETGT